MALETKKVEVKEQDLPICCPPEDVEAWGFHPRVFLTPGEDGKVTCPYCSIEYTLVK